MVVLGCSNAILKCSTVMKLQCYRTEAAVVGSHSLSVWYCENLDRSTNHNDGNILNEMIVIYL